MIFYVDIDNNICRTNGNDYENAVPDYDAIAKINELFDNGGFVIYWTGRGGTSKIDWYNFTLNQLLSWGCRFNSLRVDKPGYDLIIDDRAKRIDEI